MPHLVVLYTQNLEAETDIEHLCRALADAMLAVRDAGGQQVFPTGGVRVLAYPARHAAVADGRRDYAFAYLNLRMARGRSAEVKQRAGEALLDYSDAATYRDAGQGGFEIRTFIAVAAAARGRGEIRHYAPIPIFSVGCTVATMAIA